MSKADLDFISSILLGVFVYFALSHLVSSWRWRRIEKQMEKDCNRFLREIRKRGGT